MSENDITAINIIIVGLVFVFRKYIFYFLIRTTDTTKKLIKTLKQ